MTVHDYIPLVEFLASQFGENCEVVLHDFSDSAHSIIAIANGHVSGRCVGGAPTDHSLSFLNCTDASKNFKTRTFTMKGNKLCRSSTFLIRNPEGETIGALCINLDLTPLAESHNALGQWLGMGSSFGWGGPSKGTASFLPSEYSPEYSADAPNLQKPDIEPAQAEEQGPSEEIIMGQSDIFTFLINRTAETVGAPLDRLSPEERKSLIRELNKSGLFLLKGGIAALARRMNVSESTIYRYLGQVKE